MPPCPLHADDNIYTASMGIHFLTKQVAITAFLKKDSIPYHICQGHRSNTLITILFLYIPTLFNRVLTYLALYVADWVRSLCAGTCSLASMTQPTWLSTGGLLLCLVFLFRGVCTKSKWIFKSDIISYRLSWIIIVFFYYTSYIKNEIQDLLSDLICNARCCHSHQIKLPSTTEVTS